MNGESSAFDVERALALVEGDGDLLVATAQRFLEQNPARLDALHEAVERRDLPAIERLAHGLAGAAQNFAASDTERAARALMKHAAAGDGPSLRTLLERAEAALADLSDALAAHRTRHELRHVLIADDDEVTRIRLAHLLTKWGHRVTPVSRGDVALEMLGPSGPPHLAILDWMMPGLSGLEVCRALRARKSETYTYVVLITARDEPDAMIAGLEAGADDFLPKPVRPEELRARLRAGQRIVELQQRLISVRDDRRRHTERDGLTGAASRRHLLRALEEHLVHTAATGGELALAMIDLDDFKAVNAEHGNDVGDAALRRAAERMQRQLRRTDTFARYGGDEFLTVLPETGLREGVEVAHRLCSALRASPLDCAHVSVPIHASVGVVVTDGREIDREALLKRAERALVRARNAGGNQVMVDSGESLDD